jgi:hypothetical protein
MKNKILALLATIGLASSVSAVEINDNISINGFIDGSYQNTNKTTNDTEQLGLDEVEVDFLFNSGAVSGAVHVDTNNVDAAGNTIGNGDFDIEQAHFTYALDNGVSFTFGRYGAALGFEREDPAGLYTFSRAYSTSVGGTSYNLGDVDAAAVEGLTIAYAGDVFSLAASIEEDGNNVQNDNYNLELSFSYTGMENLVVGGGYFFHNEKNGGRETDILNLHASYSIGKALIAGEIINASDTLASAGEDAYLLLVDYDFTDKLGGAIRYSDWETSNTANTSKLTIAPNYAITDSLGAILEYSNVNAETNALDEDTIAVELTYTF